MLAPMPRFETVRVAAIQATPVILDAEATVDKACELLGEAAEDGAPLAVLPETFVPLYPSGAWAHDAGSFSGWDELWERLWANSVDVPGPLTERLASRCAELGLHCAIGVNERESDRPGSLYNTLLLIGPEGLTWKHRKLMPTMHERLFHGVGDGDDLAVTETPVGRIGGLICWENRMPLARYAIYRGGPQIWVAPTADDTDGWLASMRHIAIESGAFVVSVPQYIPASAFPDDFPAPLPEGKETFGRGGAAICEPGEGAVIAGPLYDREGIVVADCDLRAGLRAKRWFDSAGHYSREDVLVDAVSNPAGESEPISVEAPSPHHPSPGPDGDGA
jgi:nitrilase